MPFKIFGNRSPTTTGDDGSTPAKPPMFSQSLTREVEKSLAARHKEGVFTLPLGIIQSDTATPADTEALRQNLRNAIEHVAKDPRFKGLAFQVTENNLGGMNTGGKYGLPNRDVPTGVKWVKAATSNAREWVVPDSH